MNVAFAQVPSQESRIEELLEIHYLRPEMKSPYDSIKIDGAVANISVWRDLPPEPSAQKIECMGYQWLLTGRGQKLGQGAVEVFKEFPNLQRIHLELVEVDFELKGTDGHGQYERISKKRPYLKMTAERSQIQNQKLPAPEMKAALMKDLDSCLKIGRVWISTKEIQL